MYFSEVFQFVKLEEIQIP